MFYILLQIISKYFSVRTKYWFARKPSGFLIICEQKVSATSQGWLLSIQSICDVCVVRRQYYVFHNFCLSSCVYCVILPPLSQNDQYYLEALGKTWDSCSSYDRIILAGVLNFEELETCMELSFIRTINYQKYLFNKDSPNPLTITINLFLINNSTYLQNKITFYWCLRFS